MTNKFVQPGMVIDHTPAGAMANGQVAVIGKRIGVALTAIAAGAPGPLQTEGVFELAKLSTDVVAMGDLLYWDAGNSRLTVTASTHNLAGYATAAAGNGVALAKVKINA